MKIFHLLLRQVFKKTYIRKMVMIVHDSVDTLNATDLYTLKDAFNHG